ncbi:MAG: imidazolonepropionase [Candidatus Kapaibacterium sp.]|nr:MAG: imidazolonepropionase [Candidatus Kapabacteria bacterium]
MQNVIVGLLLVTVASVAMHLETPGEPQQKPIALVGGRVYTVSSGIIERGTVLFDRGKIVAVGSDVPIPADAVRIDCQGKNIYPGLFAPHTTIGLIEIEAVRATRDAAEVGSFNPNVRADVAYNPDSEVIPTVRSNGVTLAVVAPEGGLISGIASVMQLDGWTREDIALRPQAAVVVNFPSLATFRAPWVRRSPQEQRRDAQRQIESLYDFFRAAQMYARAAAAGLAEAKRDVRFEALRPVFDGTMPVMIRCWEYKQILRAIEFAKHFGLRAILVGCSDAWRCLEEIKQSGFPVIVGRVHSLPMREEEGYDTPYRLPALLDSAGIPFALSDAGFWQQRNLPFQAGTAIGFGLREDAALRAITLTPAEIFGVADRVGSIEVGKDATLIVTSGNVLDAMTSRVEHAFIQGRRVSLESKQSRLAEKYRTRYRQPKQ